MKTVLLLIFIVTTAVMSYLYFDLKGKTSHAGETPDTSVVEKRSDLQELSAERGKPSFPKDTARMIVNNFRGNSAIPANSFKSVWLDSNIINTIAANPTLYNGIRVYIGKYPNTWGNPALKNKFTVILSPTVRSTVKFDGNGQDSGYFNYGNLCPNNCADDEFQQ